MDAMHEKGIKAFPAKTEGKGNQLLAPRIERGVKVFELTAEEIQWEVEPGRTVRPGRTTARSPARRSACAGRPRPGRRCTNKLPSPRPSTSTASSCRTPGRCAVHDSAAGQAGQKYTYEFVPNAGSTCTTRTTTPRFRSATACSAPSSSSRAPLPAHAAEGTTDGLQRRFPRLDAERKGLPPPSPRARRWATVRIRYINEGMKIHPMHLHGMPRRSSPRTGGTSRSRPWSTPRSRSSVRRAATRPRRCSPWRRSRGPG